MAQTISRSLRSRFALGVESRDGIPSMLRVRQLVDELIRAELL
jgi:hypothetical protein